MSIDTSSLARLQSLARRILADGVTRFIHDQSPVDQLVVRLQEQGMTVSGAVSSASERDRLVGVLESLRELPRMSARFDVQESSVLASLPRGGTVRKAPLRSGSPQLPS